MRTALLAAVLLLGTVSAVFAQVTQTKAMISSGGTHSAAGNLTMSSNLGEVIAGYSKEAPVAIWHGFYAPALQQVTGVGNTPKVTLTTYLGRTSPNPARSAAMIEFGNAVRQEVNISLFDVAGRRVRQLRSGELHAGVFRVPWDLRADGGQSVPAGVYFVRLATRDVREMGRMVVVR